MAVHPQRRRAHTGPVRTILLAVTADADAPRCTGVGAAGGADVIAAATGANAVIDADLVAALPGTPPEDAPLAAVVAAAAIGTWLGVAGIRTRHVPQVRRAIDMTSSIAGTRPPVLTTRGLA